MFTNDPSLRAEYMELFENRAERRRKFIISTHAVPPDEKRVLVRLRLIAEADAERAFGRPIDDIEIEQPCDHGTREIEHMTS